VSGATEPAIGSTRAVSSGPTDYTPLPVAFKTTESTCSPTDRKACLRPPLSVNVIRNPQSHNHTTSVAPSSLDGRRPRRPFPVAPGRWGHRPSRHASGVQRSRGRLLPGSGHHQRLQWEFTKWRSYSV